MDLKILDKYVLYILVRYSTELGSIYMPFLVTYANL